MPISSLNDDEIEDRFHIFGRMEKISLLQNILHHHETLSVQYDEGRGFMLTRLLNVRDSGIVFDPSGDETSNQQLVGSKRLVFSAKPDGIAVQFICDPAQRVTWDKGDAFWTPLPRRITRVQRREFFRVITPVVKPFLVGVGVPNIGVIELQLHDLSVGGVGLTAEEGKIHFDSGTALPEIRLHLPNGDQLELEGTTRHLTAVSHSSGKNKLRLGIQFKHIPRHIEAALQRLVIQIDQERRKLTDG